MGSRVPLLCATISLLFLGAAPVTLEEAMDRKDARVVLRPGSSLAMTLKDGTRTEFAISGEGRVSAEACATAPCRAEGTLLGRISDAKIADVQVSETTFSFSFVGQVSPGGRLVIPGSAIEVAVLLKIDGKKRRLSPRSATPINGDINLKGRTFSLSAMTVDEEGTALHFDLQGDLTGLPPIANAGPDQSLECTGNLGTLAVLDGSRSTDPEGPLRFFAWKVIGGPLAGTVIGTTARVEVRLPLGRHEFELTVRDESAHFVKDTVLVTITNGGMGCSAPK